VAVDTSRKMLAITRKRRTPSAKVVYTHGDAYELAKVPGKFDAGLANFWFSHVPKARVEEFLYGFHKKTWKKCRGIYG